MQPAYARRYRTLWERHWWWRSREGLILAAIRRVARTTRLERLLDIGCGDALFFDELAKFGEVDGLEPDGSLLGESPWRGRIAVGPLGPEFRPDRPYDLALMLDVLEHIEDDESALASAFGAIRPGGRLLLTVPALPWLWSRHDEANEHHRRYRLCDLRGKLEAAGFEVDVGRHAFVWTILPMIARRWLFPAGCGKADHDVTIPPKPINAVLAAWSRMEHALGWFVAPPWGSSILAVARRP